MVFFLFRIIVLIGVIYLVYVLVNLFSNKRKEGACSKCDGKGYWEGTRGKTTCNECWGTGVLK